MHKVQLTLTPEELHILMMRASSLGYNVTKYIKFLISREAHSFIDKVPVYTLSGKMEQLAKKAMTEHKQGKSRELNEIDDLDSL